MVFTSQVNMFQMFAGMQENSKALVSSPGSSFPVLCLSGTELHRKC